MDLQELRKQNDEIDDQTLFELGRNDQENLSENKIQLKGQDEV